MIVSLVSIVLIMIALNAQEHYILAAEDRCFHSRAYTTDYDFSPPLDGEIIGIKLVHKSGLVDCNVNVHPNTDGLTYWGCEGQSWIFIEMIKHDYPGITWYPTATTEGISGLRPLGCTPDEASWGCSVQYYWLSGYDGRTSKYIELRDSANPKQVGIYDRFSLQYGEGCCDVARPDNAGTSCADVYFIYTNIYTEDPTSAPTSAPTKRPTVNTLTPTRSPTNKPTPLPTVNPTVSPTHKPTKSPVDFPTKSPTNVPTLRPTDVPTKAPSDIPTSSSSTNNPIANETASLESTISTKQDDDATEENKKRDADLSAKFVKIMDGGIILWIVIGVLVLLLFAITICCCCCCVKRRKMHQQLEDEVDDWY